MKNRIVYINNKNMKELTEKFRKDKDMFIVEIEGKDIKNLQEYFSCISELCNEELIFPWWESEVLQCEVGGETKEFMVYLVE